MSISALDIAVRLLVALASAAVIGWERESKNRPAGLRTHMLVALGSCLFTILALDLGQMHREAGAPSSVDPAKVVGGIVGGIGFLGAGAIIQARGEIQGLTTAAGIWVVAAIGVAAACGNYIAVSITVGLTILTLYVIGRIEIVPSDSDGS